MNLYSWDALLKNAVVTTRIAGVRTVYLMEKPSFVKPVCYGFCNGLQDVMICIKSAIRWKPKTEQNSYRCGFSAAAAKSLDLGTIGFGPESNDFADAVPKDYGKNNGVASYCLGQQWRVTSKPCFLHFSLAVSVARVYEHSFGWRVS